ncbi:MAG: hypothetical protein ACLUO5_06400 [Ruminococcus sp.]
MMMRPFSRESVLTCFILCSLQGRDGRTGMGAKGLSGEGYEGHYFWDTEMYVLPVFVYTAPELARKLLEYRFRTLDRGPGPVQKFLDTRRGLFIHGVLLMERKLPLIFHLVRPSIISMQILPMRFGCM